MTIRSIYQVHFDSGDVSHKHTATYSALDFNAGSGSYASVHFSGNPALVDEVIAELVALRAEMTGDDLGPGCICDIASADICKVHRSDPAAHVKAAPTEVHEVTVDAATCPSYSPVTGEECSKAEGHSGMHRQGNGGWSNYGDDALPPNEVPAGVTTASRM